MSTDVLRRNHASPYAASEPAYPVATLAAEAAFLSDVKHWFRAAEGFTAEGWTCRKTGAAARARRNDILPTKVTEGAVVDEYNGHPVLKTGSGASTSGAMFLEGGLIADADYSIVVVGHAPLSASHQIWIADGESADITSLRTAANLSSIEARHSSSSLIAGPAGTLSHTGPNIIVASYRKSDKNGRLMINGVEVATYLTSRGEVLNDDLQIGSGGSAASAITPVLNGYFAEVMILPVPLHLEADLHEAIVTNYLAPRYL